MSVAPGVRGPAAALAEERIESRLGVSVPGPGGVELRTDLHLASRLGRRPALVLRTPYGSAQIPLLRLGRALAGRGLAVVIQNTRGRYGSTGRFEPFRNEVEDGRATLAWLAGQEWSDGRVVALGSSYGSYAGLCLALDPPPGVRVMGVVTLATLADPYHHFYRDGAFVLHWAAPWHLLVAGARQRSLAGVDLHRLARTADGRLADWSGLRPDLWDLWTGSRRSGDPYWADGALTPALRGVRVPMLHVGGWLDFSLGSTLDLFRELRKAPGPAWHRLVVGPWEHNEVFGEAVRGLVGGAGGRRGGAAELAGEIVSALDAWTAEGGSTVAEGGALLWRCHGAGGAGAWEERSAWPPPGGREDRWYLHGEGRSPGLLGGGPPRAAGAAAWWHDAEHPVPTVGGRCWTAPGWTEAGWSDQGELDDRSDVRTFTGAVLEAPLDVTGNPTARLWLSFRGAPGAPPERLAVVRLLDVAPGGRAAWVAEGAARSALGPEPRPVTVDLGGVCYRFARGHRLRLAVASSSFPQFASPPGGGEHRLVSGPDRPSTLHLPRGGPRR